MLAKRTDAAQGQTSPRQLLHNRAVARHRSAFEDDPAAPRHRVRLWIRGHGRRTDDG